MYVTIAGAVVAGLAFRFARATGIDHTAFVFVGIPALLAVLVTMTPRPRTSMGTVMKATALALLIAGTVMGEAFICLLMASPIIFAIAAAAAVGAEYARKHWGNDRRGAASASLLLLVAVAIPAMEGVIPRWHFEREASVTRTRVVAASPDEVERALAGPMRFDRGLPPFLRLGFPTPGETSGTGLRPGDRRSVAFAHGHHPGTLVMEVRDVGPGRATFVPVSDGSYLVHWLSWRSAEVRWREVPGGTEVEWTLRYRRRLDPAWYFAPMERYGVGLAAGYLIETLATPTAASR
jgi:hypothetical protein